MATPTERPQQRTVLNVNDSVTVRYTTTRMLQHAGYQVIEADSGSAALESVRADPDVVVLDIRLPDMDGFEICRRIKENPATASVKVLLTSATFTTLDSKIRGLKSGADGYLAQPYEATELLAVLGSLVQLKSAETELRQRALRLAEADQRKDEFLAMLAHELRNPLAAITASFAIVDRRPAENDIEQRARQVIVRQTEHLKRMVDDLLDVARVTHGKIELKTELVSLNVLLTRVSRLMTETRLNARGQAIVLDLPEQPVHVEGDVTRLEQIFTNLLDNASKYMENGVIQLTLRQPDSNGNAKVIVRDNGVGIDAEQLGSIFNLFAQSDATIARTQGGLGIGLTLVRTLVGMHHGSVVARSEGRGRGTELEVTLPGVIGLDLQRRQSAAAVLRDDPASASNTVPRFILLVEDNVDAQTALKDLMEIWGHRVITAADGLTGAQLALAELPEIALVDIGLPQLDGYEVARRIRAAVGKAVYLVALTGYGSQEQRAKALEAGFDVHLVKPVEPQRLERLLKTIQVDMGARSSYEAAHDTAR